MIVTRSMDTALRLLIYLARPQARQRFLKARQIERDLRIPPFALRKILWSLTRGGLVRSLPGRGGGFCLGRQPGNISVAEVLSAIEGRVVAYPCRGVDEDCELSGRCGVAPIYQEVEKTLEALLGRYTIEDCLGNNACPQPVAGGSLS